MTKAVQFDIRRFPTVTSTMDVCRAFAEGGANEGLVALADEQTAGRGRVGRAWYSPPGQSLYLSILLRPDLRPRQIGWLTMVGALAVVEAISWFLSLDSQLTLKWPNDVLLNGRKLAGVLVESSFSGDRLDYAVLGIGLNVNTCFDRAPDDVRQRAISLREVLGSELDRDAVLKRLLLAFGVCYRRLPASPLADYTRRLETLGRRVRLHAGNAIVEGEAVRVEDDGALVVITDAGERTVTFGDVISA